MSPVTFGSVCSGIEAASVAWHPLGWQTAWLAEIERAPAAVLSHHYPATWNLGDMTAVAPLVRAGVLPAPDVLVGGTPCQAFSVAGLGNSLDDMRGQLSLSYVDLANAIDEKRETPAVIVWENVPGALRTKDNAFGCFLAALAGEGRELVPPGGKWTYSGCVYGPQRTVAWRVLDAQYFGVAQRRRRLFVIASARKDFDPAAVLFESEGLRRVSAPARQIRQESPGRPGDGVDLRNRAITGDLAQTIQAGTHGVDPGSTPHVLAVTASLAIQVRRITPIECERLQGFPDHYTAVPYRGKVMADGPRYKALGNSMAVPCMAWLGRRIDEAIRRAHNAAK